MKKKKIQKTHCPVLFAFISFFKTQIPMQIEKGAVYSF